MSAGELSTFIRDCIAMMRAGGISHLRLQHGDLNLHLTSRKQGIQGVSHNASADAAAILTLPIDAETSAVGHVITAPMIGTFYHASAPGESPFVDVGDRVEEGQTIGIIEAMKIMNEIASDRAGIVAEIIASNGQTVEYGSPLIRFAADPT